MITSFENARIVTPDGVIEGSLATENGRILKITRRPFAGAGRRVDLHGAVLAPGFIDLHVHGGGGADFMDGTPEAMETAADAHLSHGTTTLFPTALSAPWDRIRECVDVYRTVLRTKRVPVRLGGLHLEGPFLSPEMCGAQRRDCIFSPLPEHVRFLQENADVISRVTCAPEVEGVMELAEAVLPYGISLSMGHTAATYECAEEAAHRGFSAVTHLYSATSGFHKVDQKVHIGVTQAAFGVDSLYAELIGDACHAPKELIRLTVRFKGADKVCLVTDAMRAAGTDAKESYLGPCEPENRVIIEDGVAKLPDRSFFAGSVGTMDRAFRFAVKEAGLSLSDASRLCSLTPAKLMKIDRMTGSLEAGKDADLVVLNDSLELLGVFVAGEKVR